MFSIRWVSAVGVAFAFAVAVAACGSDDRPAALSSSTCGSSACDDGGVGGGPSGDAGTSDGSGYTGQRAVATGTMFAMTPPRYWPIKSNEAALAQPAQVFVHAYGEEHVADYDPATGFEMKDVPVGEFTLIARDVNGGNGIADTAIGVVVHASGNAWPVPAVLKSDIDAVYAAVTPAQAIDATRAQILLTISDCTGMSMLSGVTINSFADADGVIYDSAGGWTFGGTVGTGPAGTAFIVNVPADPPPGKLVPLRYSRAGVTVDGLQYRLMAGVVTRVHVLDGCVNP